jgi:hypothetical protein
VASPPPGDTVWKQKPAEKKIRFLITEEKVGFIKIIRFGLDLN